MTTSTGEPRPIIPALAPFYDNVRDLSWLLVRCTAGGFLLIHGIQKLTGNTVAGFAANSLARRGIEPSLALAYWIFFMETVGALCIFFGLFTRFFAVAAIVQFLIIVFIAHWAPGFPWNRPGGGWEYPAFWGLIFIAIALRGGGPYSLDRKLGREL
jgi:putative oxidoreductase